MELNKGPLSVFRLFTGSLSVANQAFGAGLALILALFGIIFLLIVILAGVGFVFCRHNPAFIPISTMIGQILGGFLGFVLILALIQLLAAKMEKMGTSAVECLSSSFVPALYLLISSVLIAVPFSLALGGAFLSKSPWLLFIVYGVICLVSILFSFVPHAIILRGEGPLAAILYSYRLASKYYLRILGILFFIFALCFLLGLLAACAIKAYVPQFMGLKAIVLQTKLLMWLHTLPKTYVILTVLVFLFLVGYLVLVMYSFWTALFLNLDYLKYGLFFKQPEKVFSQDGATNPLPEVADVPNVEIKQASISTQPDDHTDQHLEEVYRAQEHLQQAIPQEEDRMPTILFDDEMARQLAENERKMKERSEQTSQTNQEDDQSSIKMSDKPL